MRIRQAFKTLLVIMLLAIPGPLPADPIAAEFQYQLYKNPENFGILVFPKDFIFADLEEYIRSISFDPVASGNAVMRSGSQGQNATYMMPEPVQKKHSIERFIVLQVIARQNILVGVFDPDWGLTLPSAIYCLDEVKKNIPKTLNIFRKNNPQKGVSFNYKSAVSVISTAPIRRRPAQEKSFYAVLRLPM